MPTTGAGLSPRRGKSDVAGTPVAIGTKTLTDEAAAAVVAAGVRLVARLTLILPVVLVLPEGKGVSVAEPGGRVVTRVPV